MLLCNRRFLKNLRKICLHSKNRKSFGKNVKNRFFRKCQKWLPGGPKVRLWGPLEAIFVIFGREKKNRFFSKNVQFLRFFLKIENFSKSQQFANLIPCIGRTHPRPSLLPLNQFPATYSPFREKFRIPPKVGFLVGCTLFLRPYLENVFLEFFFAQKLGFLDKKSSLSPVII